MELKFRIVNKTKGETTYVEGIFNEHPWTETSMFPQYESMRKLDEVEVYQLVDGEYVRV